MMEAEYMALTRSAKQIQWMYSAMDGVGFPQQKPRVLRGDIRGANALTQNTKRNARVKHIDIRHHYVRERVESGVEHIPSVDNPADIFTKQLPHDAHHAHCVSLRLCKAYVCQGECYVGLTVSHHMTQASSEHRAQWQIGQEHRHRHAI